MRRMKQIRLLAGLTVLLLLAGCEQKNDGSATTTTVDITTTVITTTEHSSTAGEETSSTNEDVFTTSGSAESSRRTVTTGSRKTTTSTTKRSGTTTKSQETFVDEKKAEQGAWKINNKLKAAATKIPSERVIVSGFDSEWAFKHHPTMVYFKGKWYASFSSGAQHEDSPGQKMVYCVSDDFYHWSEPKDIVVPGVAAMKTENQLPGAPKTVATAVIGGFCVIGDQLAFVYTVTEYYPESFDKDGNFIEPAGKAKAKHRQYGIYSKDGVTWTAPRSISSIHRIGQAQQSPHGTNRWFAICGFFMHWSDDGVNWNWRKPSDEQITASQNRCRQAGGVMTESSWYQSPDGVVHLMMRSETGYIWDAQSFDNGDTWTESYPTNFTTASTMFALKHMPDGRIVWIGSPTYDVRWPLSIYVSEDGYNFNKAYILRDEKDYTMQVEGNAKGGAYAYPSVVIQGDYLYVFYSRYKEILEISRVKLSDIQ